VIRKHPVILTLSVTTFGSTVRMVGIIVNSSTMIKYFMINENNIITISQRVGFRPGDQI
jgi:hypothetical protein